MGQILTILGLRYHTGMGLALYLIGLFVTGYVLFSRSYEYGYLPYLKMDLVVYHLVVHHILNMFLYHMGLDHLVLCPFKLRSECAFVQIVKVCMKLVMVNGWWSRWWSRWWRWWWWWSIGGGQWWWSMVVVNGGGQWWWSMVVVNGGGQWWWSMGGDQ